MSEASSPEMKQRQDAMELWLDSVWLNAKKQPEKMLLSVDAREMVRVVSQELRWRTQLCSPAGLQSLFPALRH